MQKVAKYDPYIWRQDKGEELNTGGSMYIDTSLDY